MLLREFLGKPFAPDNLALVDCQNHEHSLSYEDLLSQTAAYRNSLAERVAASKFAVLYFDNEISFFPTFFALNTLGVCCIPVNKQAGVARLSAVIKASGAKTVISNVDFENSQFENTQLQLINLEALALENKSSHEEQLRLEPKQDALALFTSGSTGQPKGIIYTNEQLWFSAANIVRSCKLEAKTQELLIVTLSHSDGWQRVFATLNLGGTAYLLKQPFSMSAFFDVLNSGKINSFFLPTPLIPIILKLPKDCSARTKSRLQSIELGSTFISQSSLEALVREFPESGIFYHYGLTECSRASTLACQTSKEKFNTVGRANPGFQIRIVNGVIEIKAANRPIKRLLEGEVYLDSNEWFRTNDMGEIDLDGFLIFKGRSDDLITVGGHHIYPAEIKEALSAKKFIKDIEVVVQKSTNSLTGDQVSILVIIDSKEESARASELKDLLPFYLRSSLKIVDAISRSLSGKFVSEKKEGIFQ